MWWLSPLSWLLVAGTGLVAGCVWRDGRPARLLRRVCVGVAGVAVLAMTPWIANLLVGWLETPSAEPAWCRRSPPATAVVLAGAVDVAPRHGGDFGALNIESRRRVERAAAWWHERPGRSLVMAGGPQAGSAVPRAELMAAYARRLGVEQEALRVETGSTSTWENARGLAMLRPPLPRRIVVVTSAMHLPRARFAVGAAGFEVCGLAAGSVRIPFGLPGYLIPRTSALAKTEAALHELVGMAWYRWRNRREGIAGDAVPAGSGPAPARSG